MMMMMNIVKQKKNKQTNKQTNKEGNKYLFLSGPIIKQALTVA